MNLRAIEEFACVVVPKHHGRTRTSSDLGIEEGEGWFTNIVMARFPLALKVPIKGAL